MTKMYVTHLGYGEYAVRPEDLPTVMAAMQLLLPVKSGYPKPHYLTPDGEPAIRTLSVYEVLPEKPADDEPELAAAAE